MSLETLLEAAEYLERNHNHFATNKTDANQSNDVNSVGHLKIDPNLPISFQFHTYSSSVPVSNHLLKNENGNELYSSSGAIRNRSSSNRLGSGQSIGRTKSASFSVSNSNSIFQQSRATIRRNRNLTCSDKSSLSENTSRHRELHKTLEKNRRAHLRSCFEQLKLELPKSEYAEKKYSHINIIHYAIRYIHQLKKIELDHQEELNKLSRIRSEYESSLINLREQLINELNDSKQNTSNLSNSTNQSSDSSFENLNEDSDNSDKRLYSIRSQKEIDELLFQVEQSLLCASENGSEIQMTTFSTEQLHDNSDDALGDEYDDETTTASECDNDEVNYGNVSSSSILNECNA